MRRTSALSSTGSGCHHHNDDDAHDQGLRSALCKAPGGRGRQPERALQVHSFPPIASSTSRVLILGTMPGTMSLRERQYYAHPRNQFWSIVGQLLGFDPTSPYAVRVGLVRSADLAIWDVVKSCTREGSMDSAIDASSVVPNDFAGFLTEPLQLIAVTFALRLTRALVGVFALVVDHGIATTGWGRRGILSGQRSRC